MVVELDNPSIGARLRVEVEAGLGTSLRLGDRTGVVCPTPDGVLAVCDQGAQGRSRDAVAVVTPTLDDEATTRRVAIGQVGSLGPFRGRR